MSDIQIPAKHFVEIDDLDRAILNLSARMDAACCKQLVLIREFDQRAGWLKWSFPNCAEWLAWRCDIGLSAAREKVRVAHALVTLPSLSSTFAAGELSYTKVRALTRVASHDNEKELVEFASQTTATRVEERCHELRCGTVASLDEVNRVHARRSLRMHRNLARGTMTISVELPLESGELIDRALDRARDANADESPESAADSWAAQQADALVAMATSCLSGETNNTSNTAGNFQVTVHVDRAALIDGEGRSGLPIESVKRLCCDAETVVIVDDENEQPLSVGRKTRTVPTAIKRALWSRDKGCRFPGCHRKRFVDAHHIHHWSAGGETSLENLMLLCSKHHRLVHEGGYRILKDFRDQWCFKRPDGIAVPECGYRPDDTIDSSDPEISDLVKHPSAEGLLISPESIQTRLTKPAPSGFLHS